ncbi:hypothetical protein EC915_102419 [Pseudomonas sp. LP_7_YM]|nr:hypothetical protein EC915_102419 [Pseudomonas sp. LP_7_YM]
MTKTLHHRACHLCEAICGLTIETTLENDPSVRIRMYSHVLLLPIAEIDHTVDLANSGLKGGQRVRVSARVGMTESR